MISTKVAALAAVIFSLLVTNGSCAPDPNWEAARATWYGAPTGAGPYDDGGACGFKNVNLPPFSAMTSCGNQPLFKDGKGCGSCYQIRCKNHPACSGNPETVIITDMNYYPVAKYHFDLSGTAFGAMAKPGRNEELRHAGINRHPVQESALQLPAEKVTFHVEEGSNPMYLAVLVEFEDGDGDVEQVDLMEANSPATGCRCVSHGDPSGGWTPTTAAGAPSPLRITNESGRKLVPTVSSRPTGRQTITTAPSSSTKQLLWRL
ncbi:hypothetical protein HU200_001190 [Digitaria exilis]|uniref:Expansin-like EG45 domain-containing protein n=1 Tax=Digitaria exilis TaxID=1010633 RepID=A0A835FXP9_9POAL|nr:hypothetical protein HU200_001190 [Digitaria exilis]